MEKGYYMQNWLDVNQRKKKTITDEWYLGFANRLQTLISNSVDGRSGRTDLLINNLPIKCAMYLQDVISQSGGWKAFSELYYSNYSAYLPFYPIKAEYIQDEINKEDIAFIIWLLFTVNKEKEEIAPIVDPFSPDLIELSGKVYRLMDEVFEEAPISDIPSPKNWVLPDIFDVHSTLLPDIKAEQATNKDVKQSLLYNNDYPLLYFATYKELEKFLTETLYWENQNGGLFKELKEHAHFVIYANAKGILLAPNVSQYFNDSHNPTFNKEDARRSGYQMFCVQGECPFDLIKYGMQKGLLPDIELAIPNGKELLHKNWDFITRYYLREYYEGT